VRETLSGVACDSALRTGTSALLDELGLPPGAPVMLTHDQLGAEKSRAVCGVVPAHSRYRSTIALMHL
jgi:hypothetical protein